MKSAAASYLGARSFKTSSISSVNVFPATREGRWVSSAILLLIVSTLAVNQKIKPVGF